MNGWTIAVCPEHGQVEMCFTEQFENGSSIHTEKCGRPVISVEVVPSPPADALYEAASDYLCVANDETKRALLDALDKYELAICRGIAGERPA